MATSSELTFGQAAPITQVRGLSNSWVSRAALAAMVALAAVLRAWNLDALGYANHYYTAAVVSMLESWRNFFFVAAEPGGAVSIDKPPVGLWLQAISAYIFGVHGWSVLLPQLVAGVLSVIVVYHLVARKFGQVAGLVSGLALAITPVAIATDRNNTMDSTLILTLLLAAWSFIKATEDRKLRYLLLGAALVGVGFNIKMLEAYLPLPAFYPLYLFGSSERLWKKVGKLAVATALLVVVSFSWAVIVDLTPVDQRPYVGSSSNNTVLNLITGYNGAERLLGMGGRGGLLSSLVSGRTSLFGSGGLLSFLNSSGSNNAPQGNGNFAPPNNGGFNPPQDGGGAFPRDGGGFTPPQGTARPGGGGPGGFFNTGTPGLNRLFVAPLSNQASWLLPFGFLSAALLLFRARLRWPLDPKHQAIVLWGGWLVTTVVFFSVAGFFHEYYLSILAPALAALVGLGVGELWDLRAQHPWIALALALPMVGVTCWFQNSTAASFVSVAWWMPFMLGLFVSGAIILVVAARGKETHAAAIGFACLVLALMITPGIWSALTNAYSSTNQTLPAAYNGGQASFGPAGRGGAGTTLTGLQVDANLLAFLHANTQNAKYLMAVPSSMQGADYVIATGRPVLYLGGFNGQDPVESVASISKLVAVGDLRYIYTEGRGGFGGPGGGGNASISSWVSQTCKPVTGYDVTTQNQGAPDGLGTNAPTTDGRGGFGGTRVSLYDCRS